MTDRKSDPARQQKHGKPARIAAKDEVKQSAVEGRQGKRKYKAGTGHYMQTFANPCYNSWRV
ncbi:MAG: hypothetical protein IPM16_05035 [Chloroflexi bacterium]|nr:hypothetical protein [Chloroflexota bacterium]